VVSTFCALLTLRCQDVIVLCDQRLRVSEILEGNCQLDELIEWRNYVRDVLQVCVYG
jgi:hypothetical protein